MEPVDDEPLVSDDDALSLWVGRVARTHALLEYDVHNVYRSLVRRVGHPTDSNTRKGFDQVLSECRKRLKESDADREVQRAGDVALSAAKDATALRNRVVHDMWLPDPLRDDSEPPRWNTFRRLGDLQGSYASPTSRGLTAVVDTHTLLTRTRIRVSGLFMALHALWPPDQYSGQESPVGNSVERYISLMTDRFTLHANGDFDTH